MLRIRSLALILALVSAPALAAPPPTGPDLIRWLAANTDIPASHVAIAGPDLIYSLEPLGPPAPTGEVIALVRTEPLAADWGATHGFQSWEAHLLFDCAKGRMRQIRSATYPERNRKGRPAAEEPVEGWTSPERNQPAEQLMSAACDANFAWPLRHNLLTGGPRIPTPPVVVATPTTPKEAPGKPPVVVAAAPPPAAQPPASAPAKPGPTPATAATPPPNPPTPGAAPGRFALQLGRGPSEAGAKKVIADARTLLGASADKLTGTTDMAEISRGRRRYTAALGGFPTLAAATAACDTLNKAGQPCLTLNAGKPVAR